VALWTLGQLVESTAYVVEPYRKHPLLLEILLNFLKTEQVLVIRREVNFNSILVNVQLDEVLS
jgi:FKBP12-rapamycin complex-associated protein